jgi:hypothetical protein
MIPTLLTFESERIRFHENESVSRQKTKCGSQSITMESPKFPCPWTLWYHHPDDRDWSPASYMQVGTVETPAEFWSLVDGISRDAWECGMFFFMKKGVRPLWDVPENERGGAWSKKIDAAETYTIFIDAMV